MTTKKQLLIDETLKIMNEYEDLLTIRQIYYRLVSKQIIQNKQSEYKYLVKALTDARKQGLVPYDRIEDRTRAAVGRDSYYFSPERFFNSFKDDYENAEDTFKESYESYQLPLWHFQDQYIEVWLEKEALSGLFQSVTDEFNLVLNTCRGYSSLTMLYEAYLRIGQTTKDRLILYFGDYDPSGIDIQRSIIESLRNDFELNIQLQRVAITREQIEYYNLPQDPAKRTDSRHKKYIEKYGDIAVELDAIEPNELKEIIRASIINVIDMDSLEEREKAQKEYQEQIKELIDDYFKE